MNKRIVVLGSGESGTGAALLAKHKGFEVFVSDKGVIAERFKAQLSQANIAFEEKQHSEAQILKADEVIKSPGIPWSVPIVEKLKQARTPIIDELEFAARYTQGKLIAITGSNGKTTTTNLTAHVLRKGGLDVGIAGNIGKSLAAQLLEGDHDYWVLEVSSFQLEGIFKTNFHIAMLLNITPDHLDRYNYSIEEYAQAKFRISIGQTKAEHLIVNADDERVFHWSQTQQANVHYFSLYKAQENGAFVNGNNLIININGEINMSIQKLALQGKHNTANSMAGGIAARILEIRKEAVRDSLADVDGIPHRMESVTAVSGVEYINDSKATNVNATWYALESVHENIVWIVGGVDKGNDYSELYDLVQDKVKVIIALGKDNAKIHAAFDSRVEMILDAASMEEAVALAYRTSRKGDKVLLSPACASFDLFDSYEDRGNQFKEVVRAL